MGKPYPYIAPVSYCLLLTAAALSLQLSVLAQVPSKDASRQKPLSTSPAVSADTAVKNKKILFPFNKHQAIDDFKSRLGKAAHITDSLRFPRQDTTHIDIKNPFSHLFTTRPAFRFTGGYASYNFNYRSNIDTPYAEKDIAQHNIAGRMNFTVAGIFPIQVTYWIRQSNSQVFRNIFDVQVSFSGSEFRNNLQSAVRERMMALAPSLKDSLTEKLYELKKLDLSKLKDRLKFSFSPQQLTEAKEILTVPRITWRSNLTDQENAQREDSLKKAAGYFLELYAKTKGEYDRLNGQVDSLRKLYQANLDKISRYRQFIKGGWKDGLNARELKNKLQEYGLEHMEVPAKYRWLMGVRNFSLGRSQANYSELTAKNISVNGVNFEYNSWYYLAVSAGTVNYRFRDFVMNGFNRAPQTIYLVRAGIGRLERNYFILSAYRGNKQLFSSASGANSIAITGFSAETKWQVNRSTWMTAEIAKSISPDLRNNPPQGSTKLNLSDRTNLAYAFRVSSWWPRTYSRLEGFYKYAGANFQSFSSFQTSSAQESWYIRGEQHFFRRQLKLTGSLRKNEFSNPFIPQTYSSNTVFKSLAASLRIRRLPIISVGYQPMSQLTRLDNQVIENRFQTLTGSLYYMYNIKQVQMGTTLVWNKFYNTSADTGFIYYNATNIYWQQNFLMGSFAANVGASYTKNTAYRLSVLDGNVQPNIPKLGTIGLGVKINNLNNAITKLGGYVTANIPVSRQDYLFLTYEHGYLPGLNNTLVQNEMASVQFVKTFK